MISLFDSLFSFQIIEKLSVSAPPGGLKLKVMKEIAQEHGLDWDSSNTASEFSKTHEDLLVRFLNCILLVTDFGMIDMKCTRCYVN